jgi:hypothetical protein
LAFRGEIKLVTIPIIGLKNPLPQPGGMCSEGDPDKLKGITAKDFLNRLVISPELINGEDHPNTIVRIPVQHGAPFSQRVFVTPGWMLLHRMCRS